MKPYCLAIATCMFMLSACGEKEATPVQPTAKAVGVAPKTRANTPDEDRLLAALQAAAAKEYWTGRLTYEPYKGKVSEKSRLYIYEIGDVPDDKLMLGRLEDWKKLIIPEGTKFKIDRWTTVQKSVVVAILKFENGSEGWFPIRVADSVQVLPASIYDNSIGPDDTTSQLIYDVPLKDAVKAQKASGKLNPNGMTAMIKRLQDESARQVKAAKKEGVSVGMSEAQVLGSSWGRPNKKNRTITARGTSEQWVYDGGYLYFENGQLTTIQN